MDASELADGAEQLLEVYRNSLNIDPFFKIGIEVVEGELACECAKDPKSALSWVIKFSPSRHKDVYDIQYSVVESLMVILFEPLGVVDKDAKAGVITRLSESFCNLAIGTDEEAEDDERDL